MKKLVLPVIFTVVGVCFTTYSFLDTFIIVKNARDVDLDHNSAISFNDNPFSVPSSHPSNSSSSSNSSNSSSSSNSSNEEEEFTFIYNGKRYYENMQNEQINSLFTNEKVFKEREHYSDPDIYIDITTHRDDADTTTYYVADIRIKTLGYFRTALAEDKFGMHIKERTSDICKRKKGILAINGDTYGEQEGGYVVRNGTGLRSSKNLNRMRGTTSKAEDLVIHTDGTFSVIDERETTLVIHEPEGNTEAEKEQNKGKKFDLLDSNSALIGNQTNIWQVFSFGPALVKNNEVSVNENEEVGVALSGNRNQRCAIGIIAPNHYCFVVSDGRNSESSGISLFTLGTIMKNLHCETAYNLDGGGSATMYLDDGTGNANKLGHLVNTPGQLEGDKTVKQREVSDIVYIGKNQA